MLELDHVICFVADRAEVALSGFAVDGGRVHAGQGTRNVRVLFERSYLEVVWIEVAADVALRGLDFVARCARPATACPFGCVLRGTIPDAARRKLVAYPLPDAPGMVLQILAAQPPEAPFVAVFEAVDLEAMWPRRRMPSAAIAHPGGATRILGATITAAARPALDDLADLRFAIGAPRLALELDRGSWTHP
ncbi:MAG: VOC family protein [Kofleriaceae bacterium]